jgi:hypothetical protein
MDVKSPANHWPLVVIGAANGVVPTGPGQALPVTDEAKLAVVDAPVLTTESGSILPGSINPVPSAPSTIVTLGKMPELSPIYTEPVTVNLLRDKSPTGPAGTAVAQALMHSFNQLNEQKTTFTPSNLLSKVGALSRETSEYRNDVRKFYVPHNVALEKFSPDYSKLVGTRAETVMLNVKTKEGDNIQVQISRDTSGKDTMQLEFSFIVDGELSEQEQKALEKLAAKLGEMGDEFFRADTTELRGLKDIDTESIQSFKFTLQRYDPATDTYVEHTYDFSIDEAAQTQHLIAEDVRGYKVDIKSQLQTLANEKVLETELLQQYLDLIRKSAEDSDTPNTSKRFMLDAFKSMFSDFVVLGGASVDQDSNTNVAEATLAAFDSGMPDFIATFRSPVLHNPGFYAQAASMVLTLEQKTQTEINGDNLLVKQESRYELSNSHFESFPKEYLDDLGGNYTYTTEHEEGSISRFLSMTNEQVNNLWVEQDISKEKQSSQFLNYKLVDQDNASYSDRRVQDFAELLKKLHDNNRRMGVEELLDSSKKQLFMHYS